MDVPDTEKQIPKMYMLSGTGIHYVENYTPSTEKDKPKSDKRKKSKRKIISEFFISCANNLESNKCPEIKKISNFKEQMILIL